MSREVDSLRRETSVLGRSPSAFAVKAAHRNQGFLADEMGSGHNLQALGRGDVAPNEISGGGAAPPCAEARPGSLPHAACPDSAPLRSADRQFSMRALLADGPVEHFPSGVGVPRVMRRLFDEV